jgi:hypothetical protein
MYIAEHPHLSDPITPKFENSRACVLDRSPRRCDTKELTPMSASVSELRERLVALGNNFFDLNREIREGSLDEINIFAKLGVPALGLSERAAKP